MLICLESKITQLFNILIHVDYSRNICKIHNIPELVHDH